jgi:putative endonuclease
MYWTYVLWSEKLRKRYVGSATNVDERLKEHNAARSKFTSGGVPWLVIHSESYETVSEARKRELFLKSGVGREWLDNEFPMYKH